MMAWGAKWFNGVDFQTVPLPIPAPPENPLLDNDDPSWKNRDADSQRRRGLAMKRAQSFFACLCVLSFVTMLALVMMWAPVASRAQGQSPRATATETVAPDIPGVVAGGTKVQIANPRVEGTEGPVALPDGSIVFCETTADRIGKIDAQGNASVFVDKSYGATGLAFDPKGRLLATETAPGHIGIGVLYPKGSETMLADSYDGKPFLRPNDLVVNKKGGVYFTDPGVNPLTAGGTAANDPNALPYGVYYVAPGGKPVRVAEGSGRPNPIWRPNGIQLSPDEKTLYVNDSYGEYILAFDVQPDGTVKNRRNYAKYARVDQLANGVVGSQSDGLVVDSEGRLYACALGGVQVFGPKGEYLNTIPISTRPQNLAFGGPDKKTLYVLGGGVVFKIQMLSQGPKDRAK